MRANDEQRTAMLALIEQWEQSGMRQRDFYQQQNIPSHVFYYWHRRYQNKKICAVKPISATSGFIQPRAANLSSGNIEMHLPNGCRIVFHEAVSVDYLKALIS